MKLDEGIKIFYKGFSHEETPEVHDVVESLPIRISKPKDSKPVRLNLSKDEGGNFYLMSILEDKNIAQYEGLENLSKDEYEVNFDGRYLAIKRKKDSLTFILCS